MKISFRKEPAPTGLFAVGHPYPNTIVKVDGNEVGQIVGPNWKTDDHKWKASFTVKDETKGCKFRWITLKARFDNEAEAREFIKNHLGQILTDTKLELYSFLPS